jgi:hypothetical protein
MSFATLLLMAIFPIGLWVASKYWQRALFGVFVLLVFEGALRKWVFPGAQAQIYLVKDVILLGVYLGFFLDRPRTQPTLRDGRAVKIILGLAFTFGCLEVLNPNSPSVLVGLAGLKAYFLYAPIAFVLPYAIKSREHLLRLIWCYLLIAIPVAVLGFVQIVAGPGSFLNTYVSHSEDVAAGVGFGRTYDLIRTSGTFSYISGYSTFLSFIAILALGYNIAQGWRIKGNIIPLAALTLVVGAMFTTGSRTPVYSLIATAPVILWWAMLRGVLPLRTAVRLSILIPIMALVAINVSPQAFEAFADRASQSSDSVSDRLFAGVFQAIEALEAVPFFGLGIGVTHPSALTIMGVTSPWWLLGTLIEGEVARVTVELGAIGLMLMFGLRILVIIFALRSARTFKDPAYRALGIVLSIYLTLGFFETVILNPTAGLYYWGALGLVLAMRRLEETAHREAKADPKFALGRARWGTSRPVRSALVGEN